MIAVFKYAFVLALGAAAGFYLHSAAGFEDLFKFSWRDGTELVINHVSAPEPNAAVAFGDPAAAAALDEDLDYRIGQRKASVEGWRAFLANHPSGPHAAFATAEIERLAPAAEAPAAVVGEAAQGATASDKAEASVPPAGLASRGAAHPEPSAPQPETVDAAMSSAPTAVGKDVASLAPAQAVAEPSPGASANPSEELGPRPAATPRPDRHPAKRRAAAATPLPPPRPTDSCVFRSDCSRKAFSLPPILLALLNSKPKHASGSAPRMADARVIRAPGR